MNFDILMSTKDSYARAWNFMNLASVGAIQACSFTAPDGNSYGLNQCIFGRNDGVPVISVNSGQTVVELKPGQTYTLATSDVFLDNSLIVSIDADGTFHILDDSIFKLLGVITFSARQLEGYCNNRNLCESVGVFNKVPGENRQELRVTAGKFSITNSEVGLEFIDQYLRFPSKDITGVALYNSFGKCVREFHRVSLLSKIPGEVRYVEVIEGLKYDTYAFIGKLLGEITLSLHSIDSNLTTEIGFPTVPGISEDLNDLFIQYSDGLILCDSISTERQLVPRGSAVTVLQAKGNSAKSLTIQNEGPFPFLLSNTM